MSGFARVGGMRPGSMFISAAVQGPAAAAESIDLNDTAVFRGMLLKHCFVTGWVDEAGMQRIKLKVWVRWKKGNKCGVVSMTWVHLFPDVVGNCITIDGTANVFMMLLTMGVFKRQKEGMTPEEQYDAVVNNTDFRYKDGYGDRPLFPQVVDGEIMGEVGQTVRTSLTDFREVVEHFGVKPGSMSMYVHRKTLGSAVHNSATIQVQQYTIYKLWLYVLMKQYLT